MNDAGYRKRLSADLPKWLDAGWINADGAAAILASFGSKQRTTFGIAAIVGTLGALLLGFGVLAFVGANWQEMPRIFRFALIVLALALAYAAAFELDRRQLRIFAEAGVLAAGLVYAGAIALVGQTYHLAGNFGGTVLLFEAGILSAALVTGSPTMNVLALLGAGYWTWISTFGNGIVPHWMSLAAILVGIVVATVQNSHHGRIVAIVAFMSWVTLTILGFADRNDWTVSGVLMLFATAALAIWAFGAAAATFNRLPRFDALGKAVLWPGLFAILVTLGILQLATNSSAGEQDAIVPALVALGGAIVLAAIAYARRGLTLLDLIAVAVLGGAAVGFALYVPDDVFWARVAGGVIVVAAALWAVALGQTGTHPIGKTIGLAAFGLEILYLYIRTLGSLLDTALAFLVGGVLFIVLAFALYRVDRMLGRAPAAAEATAGDATRMPAPPPAEPEVPAEQHPVSPRADGEAAS